MSNEYWMVKRVCYTVVCITFDFHGTCTIWETKAKAEKDIEERVEEFFLEENEKNLYVPVKIYDGYEIRDKVNGNIVRCYKIFESQVLE